MCLHLRLQVRETETMDAGWLDYPASGDLPDDEDIGEFTPHLTSDELDLDEGSGSGGKWISLSYCCEISFSTSPWVMG